jgi:drug/metabolite transporter (DMT)-like permease
MVVLDIGAPIFLMIGLNMTTAANASLLNNFEIVATAVIALVFFKEAVSKRLWLAILLITLSSIILSVEDMSSFSFSFGSLFVLLACTCWGLENNCTKALAEKNPLQIVVVKGICSGLGSLAIGLTIGEDFGSLPYIFGTLFLGFVSYGLSIFFYVHAQRELGAAKTSAYYAIAPFIGALLSLMIFWELPTLNFLIALGIMIIGTYFASSDSKKQQQFDTQASS